MPLTKENLWATVDLLILPLVLSIFLFLATFLTAVTIALHYNNNITELQRQRHNYLMFSLIERQLPIANKITQLMFATFFNLLCYILLYSLFIGFCGSLLEFFLGPNVLVAMAESFFSYIIAFFLMPLWYSFFAILWYSAVKGMYIFYRISQRTQYLFSYGKKCEEEQIFRSKAEDHYWQGVHLIKVERAAHQALKEQWSKVEGELWYKEQRGLRATTALVSNALSKAKIASPLEQEYSEVFRQEQELDVSAKEQKCAEVLQEEGGDCIAQREAKKEDSVTLQSKGRALASTLPQEAWRPVEKEEPPKKD